MALPKAVAGDSPATSPDPIKIDLPAIQTSEVGKNITYLGNFFYN